MTASLTPVEELRPCPFCGSPGEIKEQSGTVCVACTSKDCFAAVGENYDSYGDPDHMFYNREAAAAAWNRRTL